MFLLVITLLNVVRLSLSNIKNKFKKFSTETVFLIMIYVTTFTLAIMELISISRFTPSEDLLARTEELIDFSDVFNNYRRYVTLQVVNLLILFFLLLPFFQLSNNLL